MNLKLNFRRTVEMAGGFCVCLSFLISYIPLVSGQEKKSVSEASSVLITESTIDLLSKPAVANNCIIVGADGTYHMELRLQVQPSAVITLKTYEGILNNSQQDNLWLLLNDTHLKELTDSELPAIPGTSSFIKAVKVEIRRDNRTQRVGYADWSRSSKTHEGASDEEIERQKRIEAILQPLVAWFHTFQGSPLKEIKPTSTLCRQKSSN